MHEGRHERELRPPLEVDKGTVVRSLAAELAGRLDNAAAFGDDVGDLPAFAALGELRDPDGRPLHTVRVAAVDAESPRQVAEQADVTVAGATGAVALLRALADGGRPPTALSPEPPPAGRPTSRRTSAARRPSAAPPPRPRAPAAPWSSAACSASAVPVTSKGFTPSAPSPPSSSSSHAPASRESTRTPSCGVEQRALLGHQVEPVAHRVDEQHVGQRQRGQRARPVVRE